MPTYEYVCDNCKYDFERFQSMKDDMLKDCPQCKKSELRRLIGSGAGIIFKGSGFYCTDYRSTTYNKEKKKEDKAKSPADDNKKSGKKSDSPLSSSTANKTE